MADLRPFRALRYSAAAGPLDDLIAPPYDVISPARQHTLYDRNPRNIIRIEYGETLPGDTDGSNRYTRASADFAGWRESAMLREDAAPAFYVYRQQFAHDGRRYERSGVFAAVRLEPWDRGVVKPHEFTMSNPKADRLKLIEAVRANTSPVFGMVRDARDVLAQTVGDAAESEPVATATDDVGHAHTIWAITDALRCSRLVDALADEAIYIADGHHRYETALAYRDAEAPDDPDHPANFVLMALVPVGDPGLLILPIHRVVRAKRGLDSLDRRLAQAWHIGEGTVPAGGAGVSAFVEALSARGRETTALGLAHPSELRMLTLASPASIEANMPGATPPAWRSLDVNRLQFGILEPLLGIGADELASGEYVAFTEDAAEALSDVADGAHDLAFLMNPTRVEQVLDVADAGARMPQKSTFFYPKLGTGLVMRSLS